jgi:hypothetical protein
MLRSITIALVLAVAVQQGFAQFQPSYLWLGPTLNIPLGSEYPSLLYGPSFELGVTDNIGISADIYTGVTETEGPSILGSPSFTLKNSVVGVIVGGTYHLFPKEKFDPYGKIGLGYEFWSSEFSGSTFPGQQLAESQENRFAFTVAAGARYHVSDLFSGRLQVGFPMIVSAGIDVGLNFSGSTSGGSTADPASSSLSADNYAIYLGPYISGRGSIKTAVAEGTKTNFDFSGPNYGVNLSIPFSKEGSIRFGTSIGVDNYAYHLKPEEGANDANTLVERYEYITVFPHIDLGGFIAGVAFGFAQSGSAKSLSGVEGSVVGEATLNPANNRRELVITQPTDPTYDPTKYMATMTEVRIGGQFTVVKSHFGKLNVTLLAGYTLNGLFEDPANYAGAYDSTVNAGQTTRTLVESLNPKMASISLGLSYLFRLGF